MAATRFYSIGIASGKALLILVPVGIVAVKVESANKFSSDLRGGS